MRLIGILDDEQSSLLFSNFLNRKNIPHQLELQTNTDWGSVNYGTPQFYVWIIDEDQFTESLNYFQLFLQNSNDKLFKENINHTMNQKILTITNTSPDDNVTKIATVKSNTYRKTSSTWDNQPLGLITQALIFICCVLFIFSAFITSTIKTPERYAHSAFISSSVDKALFYDYPQFYDRLERFINLYGYEALENPENLSPTGIMLLRQINNTPFWQGAYPLLANGDLASLIQAWKTTPRFEKISDGQYWRIFSPCLLHGDILHLFFNLTWLFVLGKQIEARLKPCRYMLFIFICGGVSNTAQYLTSGADFIGFSGVLCGMLAFIWVRKKRAAWEGYHMDHLNFVFMSIFILGLASLQVFSFILQKSSGWSFSINIANMAHITGGLSGWLLGKLSFFSWRHV